MRVLNVLWGLLVDDGRLAGILALSLVLACVACIAQQPLVGAIMIWAGLVISLWVSIEHQLQKKLTK
jgi:hypothetical protein